ncbi:MAG: hypothetical protein IPH37_06520 [Burkholderiales bacterium]|nr:hypothetical protein [Burkholderiales bacterium]
MTTMTATRILVVEDGTIVARDIAMQLTMLGYAPGRPCHAGGRRRGHGAGCAGPDPDGHQLRHRHGRH